MTRLLVLFVILMATLSAAIYNVVALVNIFMLKLTMLQAGQMLVTLGLIMLLTVYVDTIRRKPKKKVPVKKKTQVKSKKRK